MIEIIMEEKDGKVGKYPACKVLAMLNDQEPITVLKNMQWSSTGKKDFLTGKTSATLAIVSVPLTDTEADKAIQEYTDLGYC